VRLTLTGVGWRNSSGEGIASHSGWGARFWGVVDREIVCKLVGVQVIQTADFGCGDAIFRERVSLGGVTLLRGPARGLSGASK
jgi:hypothetical protein